MRIDVGSTFKMGKHVQQNENLDTKISICNRETAFLRHFYLSNKLHIYY